MGILGIGWAHATDLAPAGEVILVPPTARPSPLIPGELTPWWLVGSLGIIAARPGSTLRGLFLGGGSVLTSSGQVAVLLKEGRVTVDDLFPCCTALTV